MFRFIGALLTIAIAVALLIVSWPQLFGLQTTWIIAQVVSMRGLAVAIAIIVAVVFALLSLVKPIRAFSGAIAGLLVVFAIGNGVVLFDRGLGAESFEAKADDSITVLSWNILGDAPGSAAVARLAVEAGADIISLPETTQETGVEIAEAMRAAGRPMWVHTEWFDKISPARSTTVLVSPELGDYTKVTSNEQRDDNTTVLPTVIVKPVSGDGPTIVAAHAVAPISGHMDHWRDDLNWLAQQCTSGSVIMAGDFNSSVDNMAGLGTEDGATLGLCHDTGRSSGNGAVGTWPTKLPPVAGAAIDHVMATSDWRVSGMRVPTEYDDAGSDHRPVIVQLSRATSTAP